MPDKYPDTNGAYETQKLPRLKFEKFTVPSRRPTARDILLQVYAALEEKGYNPVNHLTGYILSGDPTYITSYKDARKIIGRVERDELLEELLRFYLRDYGRN